MDIGKALLNEVPGSDFESGMDYLDLIHEEAF